ncbi:hypothetical protein CORC01_11809 [Colletotrichum orchidophilum]|uniref:Uncharacterized protein n=1 Tax=Colletotrichum orchidophilum TaxID=1209926 RepID=A0A1G4AUM3_9PEZI|nr:uncharacterized protein CORC01_11809 [Colletotrichum orchidophilum]OHE92867.1 hypothetical protein CORC01_11809 [Colletotrichum orchidophilum]
MVFLIWLNTRPSLYHLASLPEYGWQYMRHINVIFTLKREALQRGAAKSHSLGSPANDESSLSLHPDSIVGQPCPNGPGGTLRDSSASPSPSAAAQTTIPAGKTDLPV